MKSALFSFLFLIATSSHPGRFENGFYTTCPTPEEAALLSDGYAEVNDAELLHFAGAKPLANCPTADCGKQQVSVFMMVKGERVFCATAKDGSLELQRSAVNAAMGMRFKKKRGEFKNYIAGTLYFKFK